MTDTLQKRHGTALLTWINRHILNAPDIPVHFGVGTGPAARLKLASRLCIAFTLHLTKQPITSAAIADAGGGSDTQINYSFLYFVDQGIFDREVKNNSIGTGRIHYYTFTEQFARTINNVHNGIGVD